MKKIDRIKEINGDLVIRVFECEKYKYEKNIPKNPCFDLHNPEIWKINDILYAVENYFDNSG